MPDIFAKHINKDELLDNVRDMREKDYVLSMISVSYKDNFELMYTFEKDYEMVNLCFTLESGDEEVESVSEYYSHAYIYENEAKELFGVNIINMFMDFKGHLFTTSLKTPFVPAKKDGEGK